MSHVVIRAEGLSKSYRIGLEEKRPDTLVGRMTSLARKPIDNLRSLRRLTRTGDEAPDIVWALRDASFDVRQGEVVGLIGRNGAGKSTLLKILSRITAPTTGSATVHGRVGSLLEVGTGFHPELTGRDNVFLNGAILGMSRAEIARQFDEIVSFAGVERFIDTPVKRYSSGMYLRLAFAVAAHLNPEILIVDEVLAVGDLEFQKKCLGKMSDVARGGRTVLFVSHNMAAVQRLCSRTILLHNGTIHRDGDTQSVVGEYLGLGMDRHGERRWDDPRTAPHDDVVALRAVRAFDSGGRVTSSFRLQEEILLEVEFAIARPQPLNVNLFVYDASGNLLFVIGDFQTDEWQGRPRPAGIHRSRCRIPANLLNEGMIRILVGLVTPPATLRAMEEDALTLALLDDGRAEGARGFYPASWPGGAIRPLVSWEFEYVQDDQPAHSGIV
ncbi:MAG TPA: polysaccharide ABC transporter ATP-binding protein [Gemmatimonadaceae bacterium]|nr:polysaccharide ABC transporter ATP-binding protein [Gemmatimonadaceae bacterium]